VPAVMLPMTTTAPRRLVRPRPAPQCVPTLDDDQRAVVEHRSGPLLVLAGPGTGKTTALVEAVVERIADRGVDPSRVLVLTFSRRAAAELRTRITQRLGRTLREPVARTFHSYAYGLLRRSAARVGEPVPRLLSGPEQDLMIRELLRGHRETGRVETGRVETGNIETVVRWPPSLRSALTTHGFAEELRDLVLRCTERGMEPHQVLDHARAAGRADWAAAAGFMAEYAAVGALGEAASLDPAELIRSATNQMINDAATRSEETYDWIFVDEYQDTDPAQEQLLLQLAGGGRNLIAVGDPHQSIYAFRGADVRCIRRFQDVFTTAQGDRAAVVRLRSCRRFGPELVAVAMAVGARLGGPTGPVELNSTLTGVNARGEVDVFLAGTAHEEARLIASVLRRAHLVHGRPWSAMAVLVRSTAVMLPVLSRAFGAAGVPLRVTSDDLPLAAQPALQPLLTAFGVAVDSTRLDLATSLELLSGPLGGIDALGLRRLRRELRADDDALVALVADGDGLALLPPALAASLARVRAVVTAGRRAAGQWGATAETVLWALWMASGFAENWWRLAMSGGAQGAAADRDLDAVMALFDAASRFVERLPKAGPAEFLIALSGQHIPGDTPSRGAPVGDQVRVLTAHAAKGLEWDVVVVAGVQEGTWPDLRVRGSVLDVDLLLDRHEHGSVPGVSPISRLLDEERRLFYVACTRARRHLILTAISDGVDGDQPSLFLADVPLREDDVTVRTADGGERTLGELRRLTPVGPLSAQLVVLAADAGGSPTVRRAAVGLLGRLTELRRGIDLTGVVTELRSVIAAADAGEAVTAEAAAQLARLASAGIRGADPSQWYGLLELSDNRPLAVPGQVVRLAPSRVETFDRCPLRWLIESSGGSGPGGFAQQVGVAVHAVAALASQGAGTTTERECVAELDRQLAALPLGAGWFADRQRERARKMLGRFMEWSAGRETAVVGVEVPFSVAVGRAQIIGRVDRLERDAAGRAVVVDLKTGTLSPRDVDMPEHRQLGTYQLAVAAGAFADRGLVVPGGAALVQLGGTRRSAREQAQSSLGDAADPQWAAEVVARVADGMAGSTFLARQGPDCATCPARICCPLHDSGRQVTDS
jgi:superfamily I DNA/RNA helicase/RecB family exonuclease